ncbi:hypothetical protein Aple_025700 [Acrocarpospora pleiomorpha]|uniref:Methyltransferase n=1 Tax=Acrocarpospora pleiomorpha TaxID=90975 RepID=A0A5M3XEH7_9ACTN|nr:SAM-dependent methyltransferase [Acrocarpospora pleiomorpha]GES19674.1 hypothetical protein Aple_025700 [Acrocarpospora pleiomorpha]
MTVRPSEDQEAPRGGARGGKVGGDLPSFHVTVANPARIWDYWLGGKDNFAADREAAQKVMQLLPWMPEAVRRCREFLASSIRTLAEDHGVRQFLDIGSGLPTVGNVHEVAQQAAPSSRVVYVDYDPVVASHARALLANHAEGGTAFIRADLRDTETILGEAADTLDFSHPIAILLINVLHFIPDADDPHAIVSRLMDAVPPGSFLVMVHGASDIRTDTVTEGARRYNELSDTPLTMRTRAQVTKFFDGLQILDTGRGPGQLGDAGSGQPSYYGIGKKP